MQNEFYEVLLLALLSRLTWCFPVPGISELYVEK